MKKLRVLQQRILLYKKQIAELERSGSRSRKTLEEIALGKEQVNKLILAISRLGTERKVILVEFSYHNASLGGILQMGHILYSDITTEEAIELAGKLPHFKEHKVKFLAQELELGKILYNNKFNHLK